MQGVFYNDTRVPGALDLSQPILSLCRWGALCVSRACECVQGEGVEIFTFLSAHQPSDCYVEEPPPLTKP